MSLQDRIDQFIAGVWNPLNITSTRTRLEEAVDLLREVQARGRGSVIIVGGRVRFIDPSNEYLYMTVATVKEKTAAFVGVQFDGSPETLLYVCDAEQLEKIDADTKWAPAAEAPVRMSMADLEPVKTPCELPKCWRWHAGGDLCSMLCGDPSCSFPYVKPSYRVPEDLL